MKDRLTNIWAVLTLMILMILLFVGAIAGRIKPTMAAPASPKIRGNQPVYAALNPCALPPAVKLTPLKPRLTDLNSKVVYIINSPGVWTEAVVFLNKIVNLLPKYFPDVKVVYKEKKYLEWTDEPDLWDEVAKKADTFIYGVAGHGSGASWGAHWCAVLEKRGVPGVYVIGEPFVDNALATLEREGMHPFRKVVVPHPCAYITDDQMPAIMKQIINALTIPLTEEEKKTGTWQPPKPPSIAITGTVAEVQEYFYKKNWTDGLPIIPPTEENVAKMLKGTNHSPNEVVSYPHPEKWEATVEKVAINAVMAGCKPEYMPVLLALVEAFSKGPHSAGVRSTNSFSFMGIVNGPIRKEIGMNSGVWALGPGDQANASIGRFLRLAIFNLGGGRNGINLMGSQGNPSAYSFCFPENEERSPWEPFHVSRGYKPHESTVTVLSGGWSHAGNDWEIDNVVRYISSFEWPNGVVVILDPLTAKKYVEMGLKTKKEVVDYLWSHAKITLGEMKKRPYWNFISQVTRGVELHPDMGKDWWPKGMHDLPDDTLVSIYPHSQIFVLVVGGETNAYATSWRMSYPATVSVDKWR